MRETILHVVEAFDGGVATFIESLVRSSELAIYDHVVTYGPRSNLGRLAGLNVTAVAWPSAVRQIRPSADVSAFFELRGTIQGVSPSIIHCHSSKAGLIGRLAAFALGRTSSVVYTAHGAAFLRTDVGLARSRLFSVAETILSRLAASVVACSDSEAIELNKRGIHAETIANGIVVPLEVEDGSRRDFRTPLQVVTIGRITEQKNPQLFNQIARYFGDDSRIRFTWVGDGELREQLEAKNISVTGWVTPDEVRAHLESSHVYLSTSKWEGMPLAVLEAMAHRLPVVLSRCVGNIDLVEFGNGSLFDGLDEAAGALSWFLDHPEAIVEMGAASRDAVVGFLNVSRMATEYGQLYNRLTTSGNREDQ